LAKALRNKALLETQRAEAAAGREVRYWPLIVVEKHKAATQTMVVIHN
jgi:hypothetical protein